MLDKQYLLHSENGDELNSIEIVDKYSCLEESASQDLEEAAKEYSFNIPTNQEISNDWKKETEQHFKDGAEWQKQQMIKDVLRGQIYRSHDGDVKILAVKGNTDKLYRGIDIKFIIVKEE